MPEEKSDQITGTISIDFRPQDNGQYVCQLSSSLSGSPSEAIQCNGQTKEHAIAIALEKLADDYRRIAEEQQNIAWDEVERSESGETIDKRFHIILHYERIAQDESKFEARHNTIMGNTVVENAQITLIEIDPDLPVEV